MTKIPVKNWRDLPFEKWTVTTVRAMLSEQHEALYGIPYVTRSHAMEGRCIKSMLTEHGAEAVKAFIEVCFADYKPNAQYPGLNFTFMYSYMRSRLLPRVLHALKVRTTPAETGEQDEQIDKNWW